MGRTNPTFREYLRRFEETWQPYRRGLRRQHQADFDRLLDRADAFAAPAGMQNSVRPEQAVLVSMLLAHEAELRRLRTQLEAADEES